MSRYCTVRTQFKDQDALILALMESGNWSKEQIEIHEEAQHLYGYHGDMRAEVAHVIIRRAHIGRSSNDIGFVKNEDGTYEAIISEFDRGRFSDIWCNGLKANYAYQTVRIQQEARGRIVNRTRCHQTGRQRIEVTGYR